MGDNGDVEVPVCIHAPVEDDRSWRCDYEIGWPSKPWRSRALGVDAVQALQLANFAIGIDLQTSPYHRAGLLIFEETGAGYGFPATMPGKFCAPMLTERPGTLPFDAPLG
jgi:hypothetical protein